MPALYHYNHCQCGRVYTELDTACSACGRPIVRIGTTPVKLDLTPFGALQLLVCRVNEIKGSWTESLDNAMQQADEVIRHEQDRLSRVAALSIQPQLTCTQLLEHAKDSMDACLDELMAANKLANGLTSLLLLDLIENAGVMNARIRRILHELRVDGKGMNPQAFTPVGRDALRDAPGGKGTPTAAAESESA